VKHYSERSWADLARGVVSAAAKMAMQAHIDGGCKKCAATLAIWQGVVSFAETEGAFTPPTDVVRVVKSQLEVVTLQANLGFRLLFDSSLQPITAGIRGSVAARQFLYETDEYYIDLRLEPRREADRACLVGQVLNRTGKDRAAQGVAIRIQEGKLRIAETSTNQFGEFQLEFDAAPSLCISVTRDEVNETVLPLYGVQGKPKERKDLD
jgi:hypothetical protein